MAPATRIPLFAAWFVAACSSGADAPEIASDGAAGVADAPVMADRTGAPDQGRADAAGDPAVGGGDGPGMDAGTGAADASAADASVPAGPVDGPVLAPGCGDAADPGAAAFAGFRAFVARQHELRNRRFTACFGTPGAVVEDEVLMLAAGPYHESFTRGLLQFDAAAAEGCLAALAALSCPALADLLTRVGQQHGCPQAVVGRVPAGGLCLGDLDCADRAGQACDRYKLDVCQRRCRPRAALGEVCGSAGCAGGAFCRLVDGSYRESRCFAPLAEGQPCRTHSQCAPGLMCRRPDLTAPEGFCRPIEAGTPCTQGGDCLQGYVCQNPDGVEGTCAVGQGEDQPCTDTAPPSPGSRLRCAPHLSCEAALDWSGRVCISGVRPGEKCLRPMSSFQTCREGFCPTTDSVCSKSLEHQRCNRTRQCAAPLECHASFCVPPLNACPTTGEPCFLDRAGACGAGAYCLRDPQDKDGVRGVCKRFRKAGETCSPAEPCEPTTTCRTGSCQPC